MLDDWTEDLEPTVWFKGSKSIGDVINSARKPTENPLQKSYDAVLERCAELERELSALRDTKREELVNFFTAGYVASIHDDSYEVAWDEVCKEITRKEGAKIREKIEDQARADIIAEVRQELLVAMREASEKI